MAYQNDPGELEKFKTEINLAGFLEHLGFTYDQKRSTRNIPVFQGNSEHEVFIVSRKSHNNHHVFMNPYNDSDAGSIIDFVQNRQKISLGQVRQLLRNYMGDMPPVKEYHRYKEASASDIAFLRKSFSKAYRLSNRDFLHSRGITDAVLDSLFLKNRVGNQRYIHSTGKEHYNTVFPIYNLQGLAGLEKRNHNFKQAAENSDKANGMWQSYFHKENPQVHTEFFISESPIDCISKFQLSGKGHNDISTLFFSSNGSLNKGQFQFVQDFIDQCKPLKVCLGNDNDPAGVRFNANYLGNLKDVTPSWEQEHCSFFLKPVTGDKSRLHLEVEIFGKGEKQDQLAGKLTEAMKEQGVSEEPVSYPGEKGKAFQWTFKTSMSAIESVTEVIKQVRPVKICEVVKPLLKDFNEDLLESKKKELGFEKKSPFQKIDRIGNKVSKIDLSQGLSR